MSQTETTQASALCCMQQATPDERRPQPLFSPLLFA